MLGSASARLGPPAQAIACIEQSASPPNSRRSKLPERGELARGGERHGPAKLLADYSAAWWRVRYSPIGFGGLGAGVVVGTGMEAVESVIGGPAGNCADTARHKPGSAGIHRDIWDNGEDMLDIFVLRCLPLPCDSALD